MRTHLRLIVPRPRLRDIRCRPWDLGHSRKGCAARSQDPADLVTGELGIELQYYILAVPPPPDREARCNKRTYDITEILKRGPHSLRSGIDIRGGESGVVAAKGKGFFLALRLTRRAAQIYCFIFNNYTMSKIKKSGPHPLAASDPSGAMPAQGTAGIPGSMDITEAFSTIHAHFIPESLLISKAEPVVPATCLSVLVKPKLGDEYDDGGSDGVPGSASVGPGDVRDLFRQPMTGSILSGQKPILKSKSIHSRRANFPQSKTQLLERSPPLWYDRRESMYHMAKEIAEVSSRLQSLNIEQQLNPLTASFGGYRTAAATGNADFTSGHSFGSRDSQLELAPAHVASAVKCTESWIDLVEHEQQPDLLEKIETNEAILKTTIKKAHKGPETIGIHQPGRRKRVHKLSEANINTLNEQNAYSAAMAAARLAQGNVEEKFDGLSIKVKLYQEFEALSVVEVIQQRNRQLTEEERRLTIYSYLLEEELLYLGLHEARIAELAEAVQERSDDWDLVKGKKAEQERRWIYFEEDARESRIKFWMQHQREHGSDKSRPVKEGKRSLDKEMGYWRSSSMRRGDSCGYVIKYGMVECDEGYGDDKEGRPKGRRRRERGRFWGDKEGLVGFEEECVGTSDERSYEGRRRGRSLTRRVVWDQGASTRRVAKQQSRGRRSRHGTSTCREWTTVGGADVGSRQGRSGGGGSRSRSRTVLGVDRMDFWKAPEREGRRPYNRRRRQLNLDLGPTRRGKGLRHVTCADGGRKGRNTEEEKMETRKLNVNLEEVD
ncbi:hypothetical protein BDZ91DRAFT_760175 [Kalaharituber pfeilii]|nr:hypothetical protein BDZ91DRAFT_760175 [Kalaharituber pfeilii]